MNKEELESLMEYCDKLCLEKRYASFKESDPTWPEDRLEKYQYGVIQGLYKENDDKLPSLLEQQCDHNELIRLLEESQEEYNNSEFGQLVKRKGISLPKSKPTEPILDYIIKYNSVLLLPLYDVNEEVKSNKNVNKLLTYVYIRLYYSKHVRNKPYSFEQGKIENLYKTKLNIESDFNKWGLIPVDESRKLNSNTEPARIYDYELNKTIFLKMDYSVAKVFDELMKKGLINDLAIRGDDSFVYDGEITHGEMFEAIQFGKMFSWDISKLPSLNKLYCDDNVDDTLWIKIGNNEMTFEELYDDIKVSGDSVVTQMIHLQFNGNIITHLDHEYIFYDIESYNKRLSDIRVKGKNMKRVKTFKIDNSSIPMDHECGTIKDFGIVIAPFIYFILNSYFKHKDLLEEYFSNIYVKGRSSDRYTIH